MAKVLFTNNNTLATLGLRMEDGEVLPVSLVDQSGVVVTWANDLAGSTDAGQFVAAISGNAGGGGAVALGATVVLTAAAGAGGLSLGAWTGATALPTGNLSWAGAAATKFTGSVGGTNLWSFGGVSGDFLSLGATPGTGGATVQIRVPNASTILQARNAANTANYTVIGTDTNNDAILNAAAGGGLLLTIGGATLVDLGVTTANVMTFASGTSIAGTTGGAPLESVTSALATGTFTPSAGIPWIILTGGNLSGNLTVALPNAAGIWFIDASGIALNGHDLIVTSGTASLTYTALAVANKSAIVVTSHGTNTIGAASGGTYT